MLPVTFIFVDGLCQLAVFNKETLYTIREVTGTAIAVTAIEARNQDALFNNLQPIRSGPYRPVSELDVKVH